MRKIKLTLKDLIILAWLILLSIFSGKHSERLDWIDAQNENVIEILMTR